MRILLIVFFVAIATLTPFAVGVPRQPLTPLEAGLGMAVSLVIAGAIWWVSQPET